MPSGETKQTDLCAHDAVVLRRDGLAIRAIARVLKVSRNTVRRLLKGHHIQREEGVPALPEKVPVPRPGGSTAPSIFMAI